jgi:alpha-N-arabinofuranosidase
VFIRYCRIVRIANFAQLVNAIAPIFTNQQGLFLQTIYHPLRLYAEHTQAIALDVHVDCEVYDLPPAQEEGGFGRRHHIADLGPFKLLDAVATCDTTGRQVTLAVVNRDKDRGHKATIQFAGGGAPSSVTVAEVNGAGPEAMNSFDHPDAVGVREHRMNLTGSHPDYLFPAHSITLLRFGFA